MWGIPTRSEKTPGSDSRLPWIRSWASQAGQLTGTVNGRRKAVRDQILRSAADPFRTRPPRHHPRRHRRATARPRCRCTPTSAPRSRSSPRLPPTIETFTRELVLVLRPTRARGQATPHRARARALRHRNLVLAVFFSEEANLPAPAAGALAAENYRNDKGVELIVAEGVRRGVFRDAPARLVASVSSDAELPRQVEEPARPAGPRGDLGGLPVGPRGRARPPRAGRGRSSGGAPSAPALSRCASWCSMADRWGAQHHHRRRLDRAPRRGRDTVSAPRRTP